MAKEVKFEGRDRERGFLKGGVLAVSVVAVIVAGVIVVVMVSGMVRSENDGADGEVSVSEGGGFGSSEELDGSEEDDEGVTGSVMLGGDRVDFRRVEIEGSDLVFNVPVGWDEVEGDPVRFKGNGMAAEIHLESNSENLSVAGWLDGKVLVSENPVNVARREDVSVDGRAAVLIEAGSENGHFLSLYVGSLGKMAAVTVFFEAGDSSQADIAQEIIDSVSVNQ